MTRLEFTLRELGEIYEFAKAIRRYRITPEIIQASKEKKKATSAIPQQPEFDTPPSRR